VGKDSNLSPLLRTVALATAGKWGRSGTFLHPLQPAHFCRPDSWVLESSYDLVREQVAQALEGLLRSRQLVVEQADQVIRALRVFKTTKADFADCLIERSAAQAGCIRTVTFDTGAVRHAGMTLIP
jgi:hypothetical protein